MPASGPASLPLSQNPLRPSRGKERKPDHHRSTGRRWSEDTTRTGRAEAGRGALGSVFPGRITDSRAYTASRYHAGLADRLGARNQVVQRQVQGTVGSRGAGQGPGLPVPGLRAECGVGGTLEAACPPPPRPHSASPHMETAEVRRVRGQTNDRHQGQPEGSWRESESTLLWTATRAPGQGAGLQVQPLAQGWP